MPATIELGDINVDVVLKKIKNVHLSVYPPTGNVRISAPEHMSLETIRVFAINKLGWIKRERRKFREQERETPRQYLDRESHYLWGERYLLEVTEVEAAPSVEVRPGTIQLQVRPGADAARRKAVVANWYRGQVRTAAAPLITKYEPIMGVTVSGVFVRQMKTKWGSCNPDTGSIRLNAELAKKSPQCLEYIVVHEMTHLLEASHNARFQALMDRFMPQWRARRDELNRAPVAHESWGY